MGSCRRANVPTYVLDEFRAEIARNAVLLDTNVLVSRFVPGDALHFEAMYLLDTVPVLVPLCVIGEAFSVVLSRHNGFRDPAIEMLRWASTPGAVTIIRDDDTLTKRTDELCARFGIDYVDAMLMLVADRLSRKCLGGMKLKIATADTRDFYRLMGANTHSFEICDMRSYNGEDL
jgi:predicted nucleic acid-binding protein